MPMLTRLRGTVLTVAVAATVFSLGAGPAFAANWTVTPGGAVTGTASTTTLKDTTSGTTVTCSTVGATPGSTATGSLTHISNGTPIGSISSITFNNCTGPFGISFNASVTGPFPVNATAYNAGTGTTSGTITKIHGTLTSSLCSLVIDGTSATANNGTVNATFTNSNSTLTVLATGSTLHIYNVSGCFGLIKNGDGASFTGAYSITPKTTITSP